MTNTLAMKTKFPSFIKAITGICMLLLQNIALILAQDIEKAGNKNLSHTIYGGPNVEINIIDNQPAVGAGFQAGWNYNFKYRNSFGINTAINRLLNKVEVQQNNFGDTLYLDLMYIALGFTYTYEFHKPISFMVTNEFITGMSNYHFGNFESEIHSGYTFYMMKPGILFSYDITGNVSVGKGLHYLLASSSDHFLISSKQLSGLSGALRLTFKKML